VFVLAQVVAVAEDERFDVSWDSKHRFLLELVQTDRASASATFLDAVVEMDLELGPPYNIVVQSDALLHQVL